MPFDQKPDLDAAAFGALFAAGAVFAKWLSGNRRSLPKLIGMVVSSAFWGAVTGLALTALVPDISPGILAPIVAVLAHAGTEATVATLRELLGRWLVPQGGKS